MDPAASHPRSGLSFAERWPDVVSPAPEGDNDPLGVSVLYHKPLRVFAAADRRLVLGRGQDPWRELAVIQAQADGIPIHRRPTGGGAVILAPGCVIIACRLPAWEGDTAYCCARINERLAPALHDVGAPLLVTRGHGDLALSDNGQLYKILGASLRRGSFGILYLAAVLVEDLSPLMDRYLLSPSRQPDYRQHRDHRRFCTHLGRYGVTQEQAITAITSAMQDVMAS